jgi:hypothetical protein
MIKKNLIIFLLVFLSVFIGISIGKLASVPFAFLMTYIASSSDFGFRIIQFLVLFINKISFIRTSLMVDPSYKELWLPLIMAAIAVVPAILGIWYELHQIRNKL